MANAGTALMGIGQGKGKSRAEDAAYAAISSPLLDFPITKAKGIVFNVVGGSDLTLQEINAAAEVIYANVDTDANIIFGALIDERMPVGEVSITVLATGFPTDFFDGDDDNNERFESSTSRSTKNVVSTRSAANTRDIIEKSNAMNTKKLMSGGSSRSSDRDDEVVLDDSRIEKIRPTTKVVKKKGFRAFFRNIFRKLFG